MRFPHPEREISRFQKIIFCTVSSHPMSGRHLERYFRIQHPRIHPDAVSAALLALYRRRLVVCREQKWRERGPNT